jgi:hypothetical protein
MKPISSLTRWSLVLIACCSGLIVVSLLLQVQGQNQKDCFYLTQAKQALGALVVTSEDLNTVKSTLLGTVESQEIWQEKNEVFAPDSGWSGWVFHARFFPDQSHGPIQMSAGQELRGLFLIRNGWQKPHALRLIFLVDFQQIAISRGNDLEEFYDFPIMNPQEDRAMEFTVPALPPGAHQLSILFISDPGDLSVDPEQRFLQQVSFSEQRFDIRVDGAPSTPVPAFETMELGQAAASRFADIDVGASPNSQSTTPLISLALQPAQETCVYLHLFNEKSPANAPYTGTVPLRITTFWNDKLEQVLDYDLLATAPDKLILPLMIKAPTEAGNYQLQITVSVLPGWSLFNSTNQRTGFPYTSFSKRILVDVQP